MKIYKEISLNEFEFWGNARDTVSHLKREQLKEIESNLDVTQNFYSETDVNDYFSYEQDDIAMLFGYSNWEDFLEHQEETLWKMRRLRYK